MEFVWSFLITPIVIKTDKLIVQSKVPCIDFTSNVSAFLNYVRLSSMQALDFPGGKVMFVSEMRFLSESPSERVNCYRVLDDDGNTISDSHFEEVLIFKPIAFSLTETLLTEDLRNVIKSKKSF